MIRLFAVLAAILSLNTIVLTGLFAMSDAPVEPSASALDIVEIDAPSRVSAGQLVVVKLRSDEPIDGTGWIVARTAVSTMRFSVVLTAGRGELALPAALVAHAGQLNLYARDAATTLRVEPGPAATVVTPLVGPRTIVADGADFSLAVVIPVDKYGNQVADGNAVVIEWTQPGERKSTVERQVMDGLVWARLGAGTESGETTVRTTANGIAGPSIRIDEVPDRVAQVSMGEPLGRQVADGRSIITLQTDELFDANGNRLMDGTVGHFMIDSPDGRHVVAGTIQNAILRSTWLAPNQPGAVAFVASVHGIQSDALVIQYDPAVSELPSRLILDGETSVLVVGPVLDADGAFVADGTIVHWGDDQAQLRLGMAEIRRSDEFAPEAATPVVVLGVTGQPEVQS